ncbi:Phosphorylase superfamily [Aspergillus sclerotialis]|uniref:Phosphorylase superfamily n=1 Tax=Aspergillus sclerotialis TaxID=2070753 RepID=A0A3A2ZPV0_9EURO|nr:Phosphorylase superfamily [Aspergillus sclerotialis]
MLPASLPGIIDFIQDIQARLSNPPTHQRKAHDECVSEINTLYRTLQSIKYGQLCAITYDQHQDQELLENTLEGTHQTLKRLQSIWNASHEGNDSDVDPVIESIRQHNFELLLLDEDLIERGKDDATIDINSASVRKSRDSSSELKVPSSDMILSSIEEPRDDIFRRLSPIDDLLLHDAILEKHCKGTGEAFLQSSQFKTWVDSENQTLFCPGIPGSGKSVFASTVVDHLQELFMHENYVQTAYIYCDFQKRHYQSARNILGSLVKQLTVTLDLPEAVQVLDRNYKEHGRVSLVDIWRALNEVAGFFSRLFIIIDALDEVNINIGSHKRILSAISQLRIRHKINLLVTSRPVPAISGLFKDALSMDIRADRNDVKKYVSSFLGRFPPFIFKNGELQKQIIDSIADSAEGMFSLAALNLSSLTSKETPKAIRFGLKTLTDENTAYESLYNSTLQRIENEPSDRETFAKDAISLVICTQRQLSTVEIQHALAVEVDKPDFDSEDLPDIDDILSACLGLLIINPETGNIEAVHYSARKYLAGFWNSEVRYAHERIAAICVTYLSLEAFSTGRCSTDEEYERRLVDYPLYEYAAQSWGFHAQKKQTFWFYDEKGKENEWSEKILGLDLLADQIRVDVCVQGLFARKGSADYSQRVPKMTGLHLAAYFGLDYLCIPLTNLGQQLQSTDSNGHTPLWLALEQKQNAMVDVLKDKDSTTLRLLIKDKRRDLITYLVDSGYDINTLDFWKRTPLYSVISFGDQPLLADFIGYGADVTTSDREGITPLQLAVQLGRFDLADLLLKHGASPEDISILIWRILYKLSPSDIMIVSPSGANGVIIESCDATTKDQLMLRANAASRKRHLM